MQDLIISLRTTATLWILTVFLYPLLIFLIGQVAFPFQANGSILTNDQGQVIGSALIGQTFTSDSYFWSRPSTTSYSEGQNAGQTGISGASNLAPSNPDLIDRIQTEAQSLRVAGVEPTADLLYTSGSSLDPHISPPAAEAQVKRVAQAREIEVEAVRSLVAQHTHSRFLGILGEPSVNVLTLNLALDSL